MKKPGGILVPVGFPVESPEDLASLGRKMKWQWFERLAAMVFEENGFSVRSNVVITGGGTRRQFDVIAESQRYIFAADCKRWKGGRYKASLLRRAAEAQIERCIFLKKTVQKDIIPMVISALNEDINIHQGVPIVPVDKLNGFINSWENFEGMITVI
jgi:hypothetical protein